MIVSTAKERGMIGDAFHDLPRMVPWLVAWLLVGAVYTGNPYSLMSGSVSLPLNRHLIWSPDDSAFKEAAPEGMSGNITLFANGSLRDLNVDYVVRGVPVSHILAHDAETSTPLLVRADVNGILSTDSTVIESLLIDGHRKGAIVCLGRSNQAGEFKAGTRGDPLNSAFVLSTFECILLCVASVSVFQLCQSPVRSLRTILEQVVRHRKTEFQMQSEPSNGRRAIRAARANEWRFQISLSFAGEDRQFVEDVAEQLASVLGKDSVFYDDWYEVDLLGSGGDLKLQAAYSAADLVVPFFSKHYSKAWCSFEWEAIRSTLLERRGDDTVIPVHIDNTEIEGWPAVNFGIKLRGREATEVAGLILEKLDRQKLRVSP